GVSKKPRTATKIFGLTISGLPDIEIAKFSSIPKKIRPGSMNVQLIMSVENQGTDDARFLSVKLLPREPFEFSSSYEQSYNLGILKRGMYSDAIFFIDVDKKARSGNYSIPVQINFMDSKNKIHKIEKTVTVTIKESPYLEVVGFETSPKEVAASKYVDLKILIKNTGDEKAEEVVVEAQEVSEYPFDFEVLSDLLGNLSPGKTGQAILRLKVDRNANLKEYILVIQLKCTGDREREDFGVYYFEDTVMLKIEREASQTKIYLVIAFVFVILGALILLKVRKS
ncbi:MAG: COG1361 S-layer family protein, partial [Candidatus Methanofastidiosia archaeon]